MYIAWRLTLVTDPVTHGPTTYELVAVHWIPTRNHPNVAEEGPSVELRGRWDVESGTRADAQAIVYRIERADSKGSVSFARLSEGLLHLLTSEKELMVGNAGWSYTLNLSGSSALQALAAKGAKRAPLASSYASLAGVFDGRTPCQQIARQLKIPVASDCFKLKWRLKLNADPTSRTPSTYELDGSLFRDRPRTGRWAILEGGGPSNGIIYLLDPEAPRGSLAFLRADDNILLFLGDELDHLIGNADFSYTLNRVESE